MALVSSLHTDTVQQYVTRYLVSYYIHGWSGSWWYCLTLNKDSSVTYYVTNNLKIGNNNIKLLFFLIQMTSKWRLRHKKLSACFLLSHNGSCSRLPFIASYSLGGTGRLKPAVQLFSSSPPCLLYFQIILPLNVIYYTSQTDDNKNYCLIIIQSKIVNK